MSLLQVSHLKVFYPIKSGFLGRKTRYVRAVNDVSFEVGPGETVGLVGESGCGKSTLGRAVLKLIQPTAGDIQFRGRDFTAMSPAAMRPHRREVQMIFQDPAGSLNPRMTVGEIIAEALEIHELFEQAGERKKRIAELLASVGLDSSHAERYPHEFSGGQRQRIGIARALAVEPKLIICDEPVSALDVSVQAQIINLLDELQQKLGLAYLFIAHDLAVVEHISDRILVMYLGKVVEEGPARELCAHPRHPYTLALIASAPNLQKQPGEAAHIGGELPSPIDPPPGCPFHTRCPMAQEICRAEVPPLREVEKRRWSACHFAEQL